MYLLQEEDICFIARSEQEPDEEYVRLGEVIMIHISIGVEVIEFEEFSIDLTYLGGWIKRIQVLHSLQLRKISISVSCFSKYLQNLSCFCIVSFLLM